MATGISTIAAATTAIPNPHTIVGHMVPASTLVDKAQEFQIFISSSEIAMWTAVGEEDKMCWGRCLKFFPNDTDGKHTYTKCPLRLVDRVRKHALPHLRKFKLQNGLLNRKVSSLLAKPNRLTAAFCQPISEKGGISKHELDDLQENWLSCFSPFFLPTHVHYVH